MRLLELACAQWRGRFAQWRGRFARLLGRRRCAACRGLTCAIVGQAKVQVAIKSAANAAIQKGALAARSVMTAVSDVLLVG